MIIQTALENQQHFVIRQPDHARMSGQLASAFGGGEFATPDPAELLVHVAGHHDEGWDRVDNHAKRDARTGLPYHLTQTPLLDIVATGSRTPDFNEWRHPFCGVISSMHTYGLYHGRYGLSDKIFIDVIPPELKPKVQAMLQGELVRQTRLKDQLRANPATAPWAEDDFLFHHYKLLQFFDTLALYFHMTHAAARGEAIFKNVPRQLGDDVSVTIRPVGDGVYALAPYPFNHNGLQIWVDGRYIGRLDEAANVPDVLRNAPRGRQWMTLVAG